MDARSGDESRAAGRAARRRRIGILALFLLAFLVVVAMALGRRDAIEADLAARAHAILDLTGETWADVHFSGRDAVVTGEALAEQARVKVREAVAEVFGVRSVIDATTLLPERRPFTFSAVKDGEVVQLSGYLPSAAAHVRAIEAARRMRGVETIQGEDQLVRARGAPAGDFADVVEFGLAQLGRLAAGRITLSDDAMAIEGRSPDFATYDSLAHVFREPLPQGFHLARFSVRPPVVAPFVWSVERDGALVSMVGYVPETQAAFAAVSSLRAALPRVQVSDLTRVADGAPATERWLAAVAYASGLLGHLPNGRVALSDTSIIVEGAAPTFEAFDALLAARRAVPEGFTVARFAVEPPRVSPYVWRASRTLNGMRLSGYVPSEDARRAIVDGARGSAGGIVTDEMRLAAGAPPFDTFVSAVTFSLAQLAKMRTGSATLEGTHLTLVGEASDGSALAAMREAVRTPPSGLTVNADLHPPLISPFVFAVRREGDGVTISGFYPDPRSNAAVLAQLGSVFPGVRLTDVSAWGGGAPEGFSAAVAVGIDQMARFDTVEFRVEDKRLHLSGTARNAAAAAEVAAALAVLPSGFSGEVEAQAPSPPSPLSDEACRTRAAPLAGAAFGFTAQARETDTAGTRLFDEAAALAGACAELRLQLTAAGDPLAFARAQVLTRRLGQAGVALERLHQAEDGSLFDGTVRLDVLQP